MEYRYIGRSGLQVSELSLGPWLTVSKHLSIKSSKNIIHCAIDHGINFFDNAERYAEGIAEAVMGQVFKSFLREQLVIATKIYWGGEEINATGLSRKHIIEGTKNSLKRLQLDYVDILFCHQFDAKTPLEEIVTSMDMLIRQGLCFYWGTSGWSKENIQNVYSIAENLRCIPPITEQSQYNLFCRNQVELEYQPLYKQYGMSVMAWSPLANGILTGKYNDGIKEGQRLYTQERLITQDFPQRIERTRKISYLAKELNCTMAQLALAWCLSNSVISTVIMGVGSEEQLIENLGALRIKHLLTPEIKTQLNQINFN